MSVSRTLPKITSFFIIYLLGSSVSGQLNAQNIDSLVVTGDYAAAAEFLSKNTDDPYSQFKLAEIYNTMGDPYKASRFYEQALSLGYPDSLSTRIKLTKAYLATSRPEKALQIITKIDDRSHNALIHYLKGKALEDTGEGEEAVTAFAKAIKTNPQYRSARIALIKLHLKNRRFGKAEEIAEKWLKSNPSDQRVRSLLAQTYVAAGLCYKAIPLFQKLVEAGRRSEYNLLHLGECFLEMSREQEALEPLKQVILQYKPTSGKPEFLLSKAYTKLDSLDLAERFISRSIKLQDPDLAPSYTQLAIVHTGQKNFQKALDAINNAIDERPGNIMLRYQALLIIERLKPARKKLISRYEAFLKLAKPGSSLHELASQRLADLKKMEFMEADGG